MPGLVESTVDAPPTRRGRRKDPMIRLLKLQESYRLRALVSTLPPELLTAIFSEAISDWAENPYGLQDLAQVCSRWRSIIAESALLHRSFCLANPELTERHLERSRALAIDVAIMYKPVNGKHATSLLASIDVLGPHLDRVRSLSLTSQSLDLGKWLLGALDARFSTRSLTSLSMTSPRRDGSMVLCPPNPSLHHPVLCDLTTVSLHNIKISPLFESAHGAEQPMDFRWRNLELVYTFTAPPTADTLVHVLARCPDLEVFSLRSENAVKRDRESEDPPSRRLPRLKEFTYHAPSFKALIYILRCIEPDRSSTKPRFDFLFPHMSEPAIERLLCEPPANGERVLKIGWPRQLHSLAVRNEGTQLLLLGSYQTRTSCTESEPDLRLSIPSDRELAPLEPCEGFWTWPIKDVWSVQVLSFRHSDGFTLPWNTAQWSNLLRRMHSLQRIELHAAWWVDVFELLDALENASSADGGPLCPKLTTIVLDEVVGLENFRKRLFPAPGVLNEDYLRCKSIKLLVNKRTPESED